MEKRFLSLLAILSLSLFVKAQVSVVSIQLMPFNVTPEALLGASLNNTGSMQQVQLISTLYNFNNELLITVKSNTFTVKQGLNSPFDGARKVATVEYAFGNQADYIRTTHGLPSGAFKICVAVVQLQGAEPIDEYCDEIESNFNQYLYLVFPFDKDTIETTTPLLTWAHSEPFNILSQGEYYRMLVTEIKDKQSPEEAININTPLMMKSYLTTHSVQYPYDAKELIPGKRYAWQVQKLANGIMTNKTEAWEFIIRVKPEEREIKYVALTSTIDASYFTAYNGKVYFKFTEEYNSTGSIEAYLKADKGKEIPVVIEKDQKNSKTSSPTKIKTIGDNRFVLDLDDQDIKSGFYLLKVKNAKKEMFYLKFYLP